MHPVYTSRGFRWSFAYAFPSSATPSRYSGTRDWVDVVVHICDVSRGFVPRNYFQRAHEMESGPKDDLVGLVTDAQFQRLLVALYPV